MSDLPPPPCEPESHLSRISSESGLTVQDLALRYQRAIERFLSKVLKDAAAAADLTQDILVKLLRGDFGRWEGRGRFRDYLKAAVRHAARSYLASARKLTVTDFGAEADRNDAQDSWWDVEWAREIKTLAWHNLLRYQLRHRRASNQHGGSGNVFYTVLRLRLKYPRDNIPDLTRRLIQKTRRPFTEANVRQQLARARRKFVELLRQEVVNGLPPDCSATLDQELLEHNLARYVRRFQRQPAAPD
jgi:RNA polymerase sigma factor (sigma-70 family)